MLIIFVKTNVFRMAQVDDSERPEEPVYDVVAINR